MSRKIALLLIIVVGWVAVLAIAELPTYGLPDNPVHNEVSERYIDKSLEETGAMNMVTAIIVDYRAYDTLIETTVLFTAIMAVLVTLKKGKEM